MSTERGHNQSSNSSHHGQSPRRVQTSTWESILSERFPKSSGFNPEYTTIAKKETIHEVDVFWRDARAGLGSDENDKKGAYESYAKVLEENGIPVPRPKGSIIKEVVHNAIGTKYPGSYSEEFTKDGKAAVRFMLLVGTGRGRYREEAFKHAYRSLCGTYGADRYPYTA